LWFSGVGGGWVEGLVVAGGVEGEVAEDLAGGGVDDADVEVGGEEEGSPIFSPRWVNWLLQGQRSGWLWSLTLERISSEQGVG
jgi:hypothetical protein